MILLVLVALVARVDAAPGDAEGARKVRYANPPTSVDAPSDRQADDADEADDDADEADDDADDRAELAREADPEAPDTGNPDPGDLDPSAPQARELRAYGTDGDRGDPADGDGVAGDDGDRGDPADGDGVASDEDDADADAAQLALREVEQAPAGAAPDDDANTAAAPAGALETYEAWIRHPKLSRLGRLDVSLAWRQLWSEPMHTMPHRSDSVWLVATWRR